MSNLPKSGTLDEIVLEIMEKEGFRSNHKDDLGGDTTYGITEQTARRLGYQGSMEQLTPDLAHSLYLAAYIRKPNFHHIHTVSPLIAAEVIDTGVNMGPSVAAKFLQRWLNAYNNRQSQYSDLIVDGRIGPATIHALNAYLKLRGKEGEMVLWQSLNCSQGARYLEITEAREKNESFTYGWMKNRVGPG